MAPETLEYSDQQLSGCGELLEKLVARLGGTEASAVLLARDGVRRAHAGAFADKAVDSADRMAAMGSGLYSLGRQGGHGAVMEAGGLRQILVEMDGLFVMAVSAGYGSVLVVRVPRSADPNLVGYEMTTFVKGMAEYLGTPDRRIDTPAAGQ
ncbi:roadblock/LC7 domain-containing protein [Streptomyces sp. NPDC056244]|uniref:roadblock/LC7 domain-containing protein n=1 Tax=Streptomyces sp. NPDC056244 TaxID=3345762 RepID=UPI0035DE9681